MPQGGPTRVKGGSGTSRVERVGLNQADVDRGESSRFRAGRALPGKQAHLTPRGGWAEVIGGERPYVAIESELAAVQLERLCDLLGPRPFAAATVVAGFHARLGGHVQALRLEAVARIRPRRPPMAGPIGQGVTVFGIGLHDANIYLTKWPVKPAGVLHAFASGLCLLLKGVDRLCRVPVTFHVCITAFVTLRRLRE